MVMLMQLAGLVVVSPVVDTVALGNTLRLVAEAFDENGSVVDGADFTCRRAMSRWRRWTRWDW